MKRKKLTWGNKIFLFFVLLFSTVLFYPAEKAEAGTHYITMSVGETKNLYPSQDDMDYKGKTVIGGGWVNTAFEYYEIMSESSVYSSCKIKALKPTSSPVILRLDYYYQMLVGNRIMQGSGYVDYQITINPADSSSSGSGGSSGGSGSGCRHTNCYSGVLQLPTCVETGRSYETCRMCGYTWYYTIPKKAHSLNHIEASAATVKTEGNIEYWQCSACKRCFNDSLAGKEISKEDTVLEKLKETPVTKPGKPSGNTTVGPASPRKNYTIKKMKYRVSGAGTVALTGTTKAKSRLTSLKVGSMVTIGKKRYRITAISDNAFKGYTKLRTVVIGNNVTAIGKNSFAGCRSLTKATLGKNVKKISMKAFYNCRKLKNITIRSGRLKTIGAGAVKNIQKKAVIKAPKVKAYKKLFTVKSGFRKTMKIKKL